MIEGDVVQRRTAGLQRTQFYEIPEIPESVGTKWRQEAEKIRLHPENKTCSSVNYKLFPLRNPEMASICQNAKEVYYYY